jgi:hypothetical protein
MKDTDGHVLASIGWFLSMLLQSIAGRSVKGSVNMVDKGRSVGVPITLCARVAQFLGLSGF